MKEEISIVVKQFWVKLVNQSCGFFNLSTLDGVADLNPVVHGLEVDLCWKAALILKLLSGLLETLCKQSENKVNLNGVIKVDPNLKNTPNAYYTLGRFLSFELICSDLPIIFTLLTLVAIFFATKVKIVKMMQKCENPTKSVISLRPVTHALCIF